MDLEDKI